jgi:acyl-CoA thioester hydrolase
MSREPYSKTIVTRWADIDCNQHMRNSAYSDWATYVRSEWLNEAGFDVRTMVAANLAPVLFEERTRFLKEILLGEHVAIDLQLAGVNHDGSRFYMRQTFRRGDTPCAIYEIKGAWFDIALRRIVAPPPGLLEASDKLERTDDFAHLVSSRE